MTNTDKEKWLPYPAGNEAEIKLLTAKIINAFRNNLGSHEWGNTLNFSDSQKAVSSDIEALLELFEPQETSANQYEASEDSGEHEHQFARTVAKTNSATDMLELYLKRTIDKEFSEGEKPIGARARMVVSSTIRELEKEQSIEGSSPSV